MWRRRFIGIGLVFLVGCAPRPRAPLPLLVLYNGDMEQGTDAPTAWGGDWVGYKRRTLHRDTQTKHSGKASLRFRLGASGPQRQIEQVVPGGAGRSLTLQGWVKTEGAIEAWIGIVPYGPKGVVLPSPAAFVASQPLGWLRFSQPLTLPEETICFGVYLRAQGAGTVWLDDIALTGERVATQPADPKTVLPREHQEPERPYPGAGTVWYEAHGQLKAQRPTVNPSLVFLGDSLTQRWQQEGSLLWERDFQPLGALNLGLGGDRTSQVLWRIQDGALAGLQPKLVVLAVGINNLLRDTYPPERVAAGVVACVEEIQRACPKTKVLVVGLLPAEDSPTHPIRARIRQVNTLLSRRLPLFIDLGSEFVEADGSLKRSAFVDFIHLNDIGYTLYAKRVLPEMKRLLKETNRGLSTGYPQAVDN